MAGMTDGESGNGGREKSRPPRHVALSGGAAAFSNLWIYRVRANRAGEKSAITGEKLAAIARQASVSACPSR